MADSFMDDAKKFGEVLGSIPLESMLASLGNAVAKAQTALDKNTVASLQTLATTPVKFTGADGKEITHNLIELGLVPSFYHFQEATLDLVINLSLHLGNDSTKNFALQLSGNFGGGMGSTATDSSSNTGTTTQPTNTSTTDASSGTTDNKNLGGAIAFGINYSQQDSHKYGFDATSMTKVSLKMVTLPPPALLLETIKNDARGQALPAAPSP